MKNAMSGMRAPESSGMRKHSPAARRHQAMLGNVVRSKLRRPNVSMVYTAGKAKMNKTIPKPIDASKLLSFE